MNHVQSSLFGVQISLTLSNLEHLGAPCRAHALSGWLAILHSDGSCVSHLPLSLSLQHAALVNPDNCSGFIGNRSVRLRCPMVLGNLRSIGLPRSGFGIYSTTLFEIQGQNEKGQQNRKKELYDSGWFPF